LLRCYKYKIPINLWYDCQGTDFNKDVKGVIAKFFLISIYFVLGKIRYRRFTYFHDKVKSFILVYVNFRGSIWFYTMWHV
jgi:hypothetical protein